MFHIVVSFLIYSCIYELRELGERHLKPQLKTMITILSDQHCNTTRYCTKEKHILWYQGSYYVNFL